MREKEKSGKDTLVGCVMKAERHNIINQKSHEICQQLSRWPSWSKAPVSGTGPKGHGFKSHS